ncbi:MAG: hypothetical protein CM1200mP41_06740 [Gammaproteobacteria bacterium]|nr:MAG: hypothetical protein CM1200mP41_06740 [Gammaproteobacteria bacterium]
MYAYDSWAFNRPGVCVVAMWGNLASLVGKSHRLGYKLVLVFGLITALVAGIAVWLQVAMVLFGPKHTRYPLMT